MATDPHLQALTSGLDLQHAFATNTLGIAPPPQPSAAALQQQHQARRLSANAMHTALKKSITKSSLFSSDLLQVLADEQRLASDQLLVNLLTPSLPVTPYALTKECIDVYSFSVLKAKEFAKKGIKTKQNLQSFQSRKRDGQKPLPVKRPKSSSRKREEESFDEEKVIMGSAYKQPKVLSFAVDTDEPFVARIRTPTAGAAGGAGFGHGTGRARRPTANSRMMQSSDLTPWQGQVHVEQVQELLEGLALSDANQQTDEDVVDTQIPRFPDLSPRSPESQIARSPDVQMVLTECGCVGEEVRSAEEVQEAIGQVLLQLTQSAATATAGAAQPRRSSTIIAPHQQHLLSSVDVQLMRALSSHSQQQQLLHTVEEVLRGEGGVEVLLLIIERSVAQAVPLPSTSSEVAQEGQEAAAAAGRRGGRQRVKVDMAAYLAQPAVPALPSPSSPQPFKTGHPLLEMTLVAPQRRTVLDTKLDNQLFAG